MRGERMGGIGILIPVIFLLVFAATFAVVSSELEVQNNRNGANTSLNSNGRGVIELTSPPDDLVWVVQLSDLHFSAHYPERADDFRRIIGPTLSFISPSLVLITGDLTDGKSKDILPMKQYEEEWIEYKDVMNDVVKMSGLNESIFYDVRGNHDKFGVPTTGGFNDFFSKYSFNGQLKRNEKVNSITVQTRKRKILFVGFDGTMSSGLRGPTNLFGHPTDELLADINSELSQWDSEPAQPVIKVAFGHFPLSFSAGTESGKTLKEVFLMNSLSAYLCGHLHAKFGTNLKRHHYLSKDHVHSQQLIQLNSYQFPLENASTCSNLVRKVNEFWEWEMGDWRQSRSMRILAVDGGHLSFVDIDFKLGAKKTIILPTFPPDARFTSKSHQCGLADVSYGEIRALVFSSSPIVSVVARIYDSISGNNHVVMETSMKKLEAHRGDLYVSPWNVEDFENRSSESFLLQIEAIDIMGKSTISDLRPFSVSGIPTKFSWTWKEFFVMGCQWDFLYLVFFWFFYFLVLSILLIPKSLLLFSGRHYRYKKLQSNKSFIDGMAWVFVEFYNVPLAWFSLVGYSAYLLLCPWFSGQVFTQDGETGYMTYRGWALRFNNTVKLHGFPDVMAVVVPHLYLVVLPSIVSIIAFAAERGLYRIYILSLSSKKKDDPDNQDKEVALHNNRNNRVSVLILRNRWIRKFLLMVLLVIYWTHFKSCQVLMKAYEMSTIFHFPIYSLMVPLLLAYTVWKTRKA